MSWWLCNGFLSSSWYHCWIYLTLYPEWFGVWILFSHAAADGFCSLACLKSPKSRSCLWAGALLATAQAFCRLARQGGDFCTRQKVQLKFCASSVPWGWTISHSHPGRDFKRCSSCPQLKLAFFSWRFVLWTVDTGYKSPLGVMGGISCHIG